jgi:hypothetical protein
MLIDRACASCGIAGIALRSLRNRSLSAVRAIEIPPERNFLAPAIQIHPLRAAGSA